MTLNENPTILQKIEFGLDWMTDEEMRQEMFSEYFLQDWVYDDEEVMVVILQKIARQQRDYYNKLYQTTLYEYNPIENYSMVEQVVKDKTTHSFEDRKNKSTSGVSDDYKLKSTGNAYNFPVDANNAKQIAKNEDITQQEGTANSEVEMLGKELAEREYEFKRSGNIGVTTAQQMIQSERDIIIHLEERYLREFDNAFMITM